MKCINHGGQISHWESITRHPQRARVKKLINDSGIKPLGYISYEGCNKVLVSGIVERWKLETNTFHLPFGEMTITLDDVRVLLGIPVTGKTVIAKAKDRVEVIDMTTRLLGLRLEDVETEVKSRPGQSVSLSWLKDQFSTPKKGAIQPDGRRGGDVFPPPDTLVRAYILYLLGTTLFTHKSGTRVSLSLLQLLEDVENIGSYGWGGAALALMYRQLGIASRAEANQIGGYMTLLEVYYYTF